MSLFRLYVSKDTLKFSVAHMTVFPGGNKERMHGHNFQVGLAVELSQADFKSMIDFGFLKSEMSKLCNEWNEHVLVPGQSEFFKRLECGPEAFRFSLCGKEYSLPFEDVIELPVDNVTTETLAQQFCMVLYERNRATFDVPHVEAIEASVTESPGQGATFRFEP